MKQILIKNKTWIIYLSIFYILLFVFVPNQEKDYLKQDIENFEDKYYLKFAIICSSILGLMVLTIGLAKKKTTEELLNNLISVLIFSFWFFVFFQSILIGLALFVNKQFKEVEISKSYKLIGITEKKFLFAYNINSKNDFLDKDDYRKITKIKNIDHFYNGKIIQLKFNKGILGINYIPE